MARRRREYAAALDLGFARAAIPAAWFEYNPRLLDDFYGVQITFNRDGSTTTTYHGGYRPRPFTPDELEI